MGPNQEYFGWSPRATWQQMSVLPLSDSLASFVDHRFARADARLLSSTEPVAVCFRRLPVHDVRASLGWLGARAERLHELIKAACKVHLAKLNRAAAGKRG